MNAFHEKWFRQVKRDFALYWIEKRYPKIKRNINFGNDTWKLKMQMCTQNDVVHGIK